MRTPRLIVIAAFVFTSLVLFWLSTRSPPSTISKTRSSSGSSSSNKGDISRHGGRLSSIFSFSTPLALFPPNAVVSLTDDNTTSFLARPANFGPLLPTRGLSGQLWIGSGFGDDGHGQGGFVAGAEGELGCSDVPGWVDNGPDDITEFSLAQKRKSRAAASREFGLETEMKRTAMPRIVHGEYPNAAGILDDNTDDHLQTAHVSSKTRSHPMDNLAGSRSGHADIQSLQEGAEISGKVVLLSRGGCGFLEKVKWVQRRGGIALIVGDHTIGGQLIQMSARGDTSNITIPAVFTSHTTAHILSSLIPSGRYFENDKSRKSATEVSRKPDRSSMKRAVTSSKSTRGWLRSLGGVKDLDVETNMRSFVEAPESVVADGTLGDDSKTSSMSNRKDSKKYIADRVESLFNGDDDNTEKDHEGLWVTLAPTSAASPFFDTLLVLVVSPLITLSVVYTLLILRSRIRRRRWRAPKSVVERLPVRTYQTVNTPDTASRLPSPASSSPNTPLLQHRDSGSPRSSSRTTSCLPELSLSRTTSGEAPQPDAPRTEPEKVAGSAGGEWKKFMGKQVECVVCLEEYVDGVSRVMSLPCGHEFHVDCITPWLTTRRRTCPICKGDVVRSLARGTPTPATPYHDDSEDEEDIQTQAAETTNDSPSAALPIPGDVADDRDLESGIASSAPARLRSGQPRSWRTLLSSSLASSSRTMRARAEEDRAR